jgi:hypothetical protein
MTIKKTVVEKSADALLKKAEECLDLAQAQHEMADKQHTSADKQYGSADILETLGHALQDDAVKLKTASHKEAVPGTWRNPQK